MRKSVTCQLLLLFGASTDLAIAEDWKVEYILPKMTLTDARSGEPIIEVSYGTQEIYSVERIAYAETINMDLVNGQMFAYDEEYRLFQCFSERLCRVYMITYPTFGPGVTLNYKYASFPTGTDMRDPDALKAAWPDAKYYSSSLNIANILLEPYSDEIDYKQSQVQYDPSNPDVYASVEFERNEISATLTNFRVTDTLYWKWLDYRTKEELLCGPDSEIEFDLNAQVLVYGIVYIAREERRSTSLFQDKAIEYFENRASYQAEQCNQTVILTDSEAKYEAYESTDRVFDADGSESIVMPDGTKKVVVEAGEKSSETPSYESIFESQPDQEGEQVADSGSTQDTTNSTETSTDASKDKTANSEEESPVKTQSSTDTSESSTSTSTSTAGDASSSNSEVTSDSTSEAATDPASGASTDSNSGATSDPTSGAATDSKSGESTEQNSGATSDSNSGEITDQSSATSTSESSSSTESQGGESSGQSGDASSTTVTESNGSSDGTTSSEGSTLDANTRVDTESDQSQSSSASSNTVADNNNTSVDASSESDSNSGGSTESANASESQSSSVTEETKNTPSDDSNSSDNTSDTSQTERSEGDVVQDLANETENENYGAIEEPTVLVEGSGKVTNSTDETQASLAFNHLKNGALALIATLVLFAN